MSTPTLSLAKGGSISLAKADPTLVRVQVGLGWNARTTNGAPFDLDATAFLCRSDGKVRSNEDFIFYNQLASSCGSVLHTGDNRTGDGDGDDEQIHIFLNKVPQDIDAILVAVTIHEAETRKQNFGQVGEAYIRLVNLDNQAEVARYDLAEDASTETAMVFGAVYRDKSNQGQWKFRAIGDGYVGGLAILARQVGVQL